MLENSIFLIWVPKGGGDISYGTGFYAYGYIFTCYHVISSPRKRICVVKQDRTLIEINIEASKFYQDRDLVLLKPKEVPCPELSFHLDISIAKDTHVYSIGFSSVTAEYFRAKKKFPLSQLTASVKIVNSVSPVEGYTNRTLIQIWLEKCQFPGGASGSPLFLDVDGAPKVIGMNYYSFYPPGAAERKNEAIAIHAYDLRSVLYDLGISDAPIMRAVAANDRERSAACWEGSSARGGSGSGSVGGSGLRAGAFFFVSGVAGTPPAEGGEAVAATGDDGGAKYTSEAAGL